MNIRLLNIESRLIIYGIPLAVIATASMLALTTLPNIYPELAIGILLDLTITAPVFFVLLSRKHGTSKLALSAFFLSGIMIASITLPAENQPIISFIRVWIPVFVEAGILAFLGYTTYRAIKSYKSRNPAKPAQDVIEILNQASRKALGDSIFARFVAYEAAVFYYALISWKKTTPSDKRFTYHKKNGMIAVGLAFAFIIVAETFVFHYLISFYSIYLAWILTISSIYTLILIVAQLKASIQRPIEIDNGKLFVRYGIFGEAEVDLDNIETIETSIFSGDKIPGQKSFSIFEQCNTKIVLKEKTAVYGFYGIKSECKSLILSVDENEKLKNLIEQNVAN